MHNHYEISLQTKPKHERGEEEGQRQLGESQGRGEGGEAKVRDVLQKGGNQGKIFCRFCKKRVRAEEREGRPR